MILSIDDLRDARQAAHPAGHLRLCRRRLLRGTTLRRNTADLDAIDLSPAGHGRCVEDLARDDTAGHARLDAARHRPHGLAGLFHADGEILGARAAAAFGIPFCLSTMSICSIEDVRAATEQPFWFQQYLMKDRGFNQELIDRAVAAQCSALDAHAGFAGAGRAAPRSAQRPYHSAAAHPAQCLGRRDQTGLGDEGYVRQTAHFRQSGRPDRRLERHSYAGANGRTRSSTRRRIGATWNGSAAAGPAD